MAVLTFIVNFLLEALLREGDVIFDMYCSLISAIWDRDVGSLSRHTCNTGRQ